MRLLILLIRSYILNVSPYKKGDQFIIVDRTFSDSSDARNNRYGSLTHVGLVGTHRENWRRGVFTFWPDGPDNNPHSSYIFTRVFNTRPYLNRHLIKKIKTHYTID